MNNNVVDKYFNWMYDLMCSKRFHKDISYRKLFMTLHDIEFTYSIEKDFNRAEDGIDLRYRFATSTYNRYVDEVDDIVEELDGPCSVLEMLIALAIRCEENIMDDPAYGNRSTFWFWGMIRNLGLSSTNDERFDKVKVIDAVNIFLNREYAPDGRGGLFTIKNCTEDLRDVEIWVQLCWYLDTIS